MERLQAIRELMDAYEVTQRETSGPVDYLEDIRFRDEALNVPGVTRAEIAHAGKLPMFERSEI